MIFRLTPDLVFPDPALADEDGLLAIGGDLSTERLLLAYRNGIFPWPSEGQPLVWYSPPERFVLFPKKLHVSGSMQKVFQKNVFELTINRAFTRVISACARMKRKRQQGTWITRSMQEAYIRLHEKGFALSAEAWMDGKLVGGLYGVLIGRVFCGESMFSEVSNASKAAFIHLLSTNDFRLVDCQVYTSHLESLGAEMIPREEYLELLIEQSGI